MTTTATPTAWQQAAEQRLAAATTMVARAGLELLVPPEQAARALARCFNRHRIGSAHIAMVGQAMTARRYPEASRPLVERLIRDLVRRGQPPYLRAVEGALQRHLAAQAGRANRPARRRQRIAPIVATAGPVAAQAAADFWRAHQQPPTLRQLAQLVGWRSADAWQVAEGLIHAGWLTPHSIGLQPGPKARGKAAEP